MLRLVFQGFFFWQMTMGSAKKKPFCTSTYNQTKMSFLLCATARVIARNQACHVTNQLKISSLNLRLWKVPTRNHFVLSQTKMSFWSVQYIAWSRAARVIARYQAYHVTYELKTSSINLQPWEVPKGNHFVLIQKMSFCSVLKSGLLDSTEVGRAPLIHFEKIFFQKGFL